MRLLRLPYVDLRQRLKARGSRNVIIFERFVAPKSKIHVERRAILSRGDRMHQTGDRLPLAGKSSGS